MNYYSDGDLERTLANLPLEEAPADLRASILAATIYRQPVPVKAWEAWLMGGCVAVIAWLLVLMLRGGPGPILTTLDAIGGAVLAFFTPATLLWAAIGGSITIWLLQLSLPGMQPHHQKAVRR